jgi:hypothetical protein
MFFGFGHGMMHHRVGVWQRICIPERNVMGVGGSMMRQVVIAEKVPFTALMLGHLRDVPILAGPSVKAFYTPMLKFALPVNSLTKMVYQIGTNERLTI